MYSIYKITSPSGKFYIGLTKMTVMERWQKHCRKAFAEKKQHPFYAAIRKYGVDSFHIEAIDTAEIKREAQEKEQWWIAHSAQEKLYNLSPGGEADGETGARLFWEELSHDPQRREAYLAHLSATKRTADWSDYADMSAKATEWRKGHPKEAYKLAYRAIRIARRTNPKKEQADQRPLKERLLWKYKREVKTRENALAQWSSRSEKEKRELADKISDSQKEYWKSIADPQERKKKTQAARDAIDRKKQGAAASSGLKRFWEELRQDPERYRAYMERRTKSLNETTKKKKDENI